VDERTPDYPWLESPAEPAVDAERSWSTPPAEPVDSARPPWAPAVWEPAAAPEPEPVSSTEEQVIAPVLEGEPKPSLLRKEISFRRKPKAEKAPRERSRSISKKQVSLRRKPKAEPPTAADAQPKPASFLKKDLSFRRTKPAAPHAPKAKTGKPRRQPKAKQAEVVAKKLVGLKIGASQLAAARVLNNGSAQVAQVARGPLEPGIVVGGELRDPDRLADALRAFFARHKLPKRGVRLGIANSRIGVRVFELEGIDDPRQLANAIRFRAQEALPIPLDEAVLDYQVLDERVDEDGRTVRRILLVVAYRELIDRYVNACRKAGIQLVGIDLEAFALLRALFPSAPAPGGAEPAALVAVSLGADRSTFAVSNGTTCEFTRVLDWGGVSLDVALARALDLAPSEAEPIKRAVGLEDGGAYEGLTEEQVATAQEALRREVQTFARELVSSLQFYQNQPGSLGIAEIVITGGTAHLAGLAEQLQKLIGVRVCVGDPLEHVRTGKRLRSDEQIGSLSVAIGLGVER
jgi:type IV pilus assembly protein PilM